MFKKAVVGGTFNTLHKGHKKLLEIAFSMSEEVLIGLTSDAFASRFRASETRPYVDRKNDLADFLVAVGGAYEVTPIDDIYGFSTLDPDLEAIVVSEETLLRAEEINTIRFKKNLGKLVIVVVPLVLSEDGRPISCDLIDSGVMDPQGRIKK